MKKLINLLILVIIVLLVITNTVYAATPSFSIELVADKTTIARGEEVTVTLKVKDFSNMSEGIYALFAEIEYDKNYFEELTASNISGKGTWSSAPTFNVANNQLTADSGTGIKTNSEVFSVKFKVKQTAQIGGTTTIKIKNFQGSEGDMDINANNDATINIKIGTNNDTNNNNDNTNNNGDTDSNSSNNNDGTDTNGSNNNDGTDTNGSNNNNGSTSNSGSNNNGSINNNNGANSSKNNNNKDTSTSNTKLPQTGEAEYIIVAIIIIALSIFAYIKYKKYKEIK